MVRPSPHSLCQLWTWASRLRKAFLESGTSRYGDQRRNWKCRTTSWPSWSCRKQELWGWKIEKGKIFFFSPKINHHTCIKIHYICSTHIAHSIKHLALLSISRMGFCQKHQTGSSLAVELLFLTSNWLLKLSSSVLLETRLTRAVPVNQNSDVVYIDYVD